MSGQKKVLKQSDVPSRKIPNWPQLSVKDIYPQATKLHPELLDYLPDPTGKKKERLPERVFFYRVFYKLFPETVEQLVKDAAIHRTHGKKNLQDQQWGMKVKPEWMDELLKYEFVSSKFLCS